MSVEALAIVLNHSRAKGTAKVVALGIANHDGDRGSFPSHGTLAVYANVAVSNVKTAIEQLEGHTPDCKPACKLHLDEPEIVVESRAGGYADTPLHERTNRYRIVLTCPPNCDRTTAHRVLCTVCGKQLPPARRRVGYHTACLRRASLAVPQPGIADDPGLPADPGMTGYPKGESPAGYKPSFNPLNETSPAPSVSDRARDLEVEAFDEATRWALECPARWDSRGSGHVEGHHGRCAECHQLIVRTDEGLRLRSADSGDAAPEAVAS